MSRPGLFLPGPDRPGPACLGLSRPGNRLHDFASRIFYHAEGNSLHEYLLSRRGKPPPRRAHSGGGGSVDGCYEAAPQREARICEHGLLLHCISDYDQGQRYP